MHPAIVLVLILLTALLTYVWMRGRSDSHIKDLADQLAEIRMHKMRNTNVLKNHGNSSWEPLIREINRDIEEQRENLKNQVTRERNLRQQISDLSHDLRTPLTSLKGYLSLLKEDRDNPDLLQLAEKRTEALQHLVENIYEISRYEDPSLHLKLTMQNPRVILEDQLLAFYNEFSNSGLNLDLRMQSNQTALLSRPELERIYQNLLKNAIRYAHSYLRVEHDDDGSGQVHTRFANDLSEEQKADLHEKGVDALFERFYTADASRTGGSTGLGLYLAKLLAERMKAVLTVELVDQEIRFTLSHLK